MNPYHFISMNARLISAVTTLSVGSAIVYAQEAFQLPALALEKDGAIARVWVVAATKNSVRYKETEVSSTTVDRKLSDLESIYVFEPSPLSEAIDVFESRKFSEAKAQFAAIREQCETIAPLPGGPAVIAAFYELESMRKLGDLEGLAKAMERFIKDPLVLDAQQKQVELYVMWDALRTESWERLETLAKNYENTSLSGNLRAQVAYLHGKALEGLERPKEALIPYAIAMTADAGDSVEVAGPAALRVLAIHLADEEVKTAMKVWGTKDENKNGAGYSDLIEAAAIAELYELSLGAGNPLPAEAKELSKFRVKVAQG